jgi:hypothetical protein
MSFLRQARWPATAAAPGAGQTGYGSFPDYFAFKLCESRPNVKEQPALSAAGIYFIMQAYEVYSLFLKLLYKPHQV